MHSILMPYNRKQSRFNLANQPYPNRDYGTSVVFGKARVVLVCLIPGSSQNQR